MSYEAWGDGDEYFDDGRAEKLLDEGWLDADQAKLLHDAGNAWIRAHRDRLSRHDLRGDLQIALRAAERDLEDALIEVFGERITLDPAQEGQSGLFGPNQG